ncbi:hypothetical protein CR513_05792, partial [Mucuna pruriens]
MEIAFKTNFGIYEWLVMCFSLTNIPSIFMSEKLNGSHLNYSPYDRELYDLIRALQTDHEDLKHLRGKGKLNKRHAKWTEFLEKFPYVIKHKQGELNVIVNVLSRRHTLIAILETKMLGHDCIRELYKKEIDFIEPFSMCIHAALHYYYRHDGFLFKGERLCVPISCIRQLLVKELHEGGLMGHFEEHKTFDVLNEHFFWSHMRKDVHNVSKKCLTVKWQSLKFLHMNCILHSIFPLLLGLIFQWILCLDCLDLKEVEIPFL